MMSRTADVVTATANEPVVSALGENDLAEAARIVRVAFGTFIGVPDPENFWSDREARWRRSSRSCATFEPRRPATSPSMTTAWKDANRLASAPMGRRRRRILDPGGSRWTYEARARW